MLKNKLTALVILICVSCLIVAGLLTLTVSAASANSHYSLEGAKYQLYTNSSCTAKAKDVNGDNAVLVTDASGSSNTLDMDPGTYYAKEVTASKGYKKDSTVYTVEVKASENASFRSSEPPVYGEPDFRVFKTDKDGEFDEERLEGAEFIVKYYDVTSKADIANSSPTDWWKFKTVKKEAPENAPAGTYWAGFDWKKDTPISSSRSGSALFYKDGSNDRVLPLGWFTIEETRAPDGFKLTNKVYYGQIKQNGSDGDAETAIDGAKDDNRLHVKVMIFEDTSCITSIKKTDSESGEWVAGAELQVLKGSTVVDEWTTGAEAHKIKALKAGTYTLREVSAPYGYDIADDVQFTVKEGSDTNVEMKNVPITISTYAADADAGKQIGCVKADENITDSVHITGLHEGRDYSVKGVLMDRSSGETIKDADGNDVAAVQTFTATEETMDVTVDIPVDSTGFEAGGRTVVFETLSRTSAVHDETVPAELQDHSDIENSDQTIVFPGISTVARDKTSGTGNLLAGPDAVITDTVTYKGVLPGETYTLEGELYDKTADSLTGITAAAEFSPDEENGTADMEFSFDATGMEGHILVVYETLKLGDVVLTEHKNPDDDAQTIYVPKLETSAGIQKGNSEIRDVVSYENLLPGRDYVFRGWLVDTVTGTKVPGSDGSVDLASGSDTSGEIEMILKTEKYDDMPGHSLTAFEELYLIRSPDEEDKDAADGTDSAEGEEILIAFHKDINDNDQTVGIYSDLKIRKKVTGNDGDRLREYDFLATFNGLMPDTAYEMEGDDSKTFMSDMSGSATVPFRLSNKEEVTVKRLPKGAEYQIEESPSGHETSFEVSSEDMKDKGARIVSPEGSNAKEPERSLSTAFEQVDLFDGTVIVSWENHREKAAPETGDRSSLILLSGMACAAAAALAALIAARRRKRKTQ